MSSILFDRLWSFCHMRRGKIVRVLKAKNSNNHWGETRLWSDESGFLVFTLEARKYCLGKCHYLIISLLYLPLPKAELRQGVIVLVFVVDLDASIVIFCLHLCCFFTVVSILDLNPCVLALYAYLTVNTLAATSYTSTSKSFDYWTSKQSNKGLHPGPSQVSFKSTGTLKGWSKR